jgi:RNA polymerase sigma-70 factor (ECF subfamily)
MAENAPTAAPRFEATATSSNSAELFDRLYSVHFAFVYRSLFRLGVASEALDDATQDTFLIVLRHIQRFESGTSERAWLFAISRRVAADYRRSRDRRRTSGGLDESTLPSSTARPDEAVAQAQAWSFVERFMAELSESRRLVFMLGELEQLPAPEVGAALGLNVNTVYTQLRTTREAFLKAWRREQIKGGGSSRG